MKRLIAQADADYIVGADRIVMWLMTTRLANIEMPRSGIAQLVEQRPVKAMVGGSSPPAGAESVSKLISSTRLASRR